MEKQNNNTPRLRFPGFTGEWVEKKLGDITINEDNKRRPITKSDRKKGAFPYYGANGIQDYVDDYLFDGDYLLVGEDGSVLTKDNTPVTNWVSGKFWVNNHAHVLSQKEGTSLKLISYILSTIKIQGLVTGIPPKLKQENLNNILVPIPADPAEQEKIASVLMEMDKEGYCGQREEKWTCSAVVPSKRRNNSSFPFSRIYWRMGREEVVGSFRPINREEC